MPFIYTTFIFLSGNPGYKDFRLQPLLLNYIFIPMQNRCIEVKSTWTAKKGKDYIFLKQEAAKKLGYIYEIWVYDHNGNRIEEYK
uniref:Uncharacterized protein n=1 Tax=viral metagenome TaxID=1070528 RepID=A0A6C0HD07_9ZZZZ